MVLEEVCVEPSSLSSTPRVMSTLTDPEWPYTHRDAAWEADLP